MRAVITLVLCLAAGCAHEDRAIAGRGGLVASPSPAALHLALAPLIPQLTEIAEASWGTPHEWGRLLGERTTLRFLPRLDSLITDRAVVQDVRLDSAWVAGWVRRGMLAAVCPLAAVRPCEQENQTLAVQVLTARWEGSERVVARVLLWRTPDFATEWEAVLERHAGTWRVASKHMTMIT